MTTYGLPFSAKSDPRTYLQSIQVGHGLVCATNAHMVLICDEPEAVGFDVLIPGCRGEVLYAVRY